MRILPSLLDRETVIKSPETLIKHKFVIDREHRIKQNKKMEKMNFKFENKSEETSYEQ